MVSTTKMAIVGLAIFTMSYVEIRAGNPIWVDFVAFYGSILWLIFYPYIFKTKEGI